MNLESLGYVAIAMVLGAVVGFERELADKPAGLRTHMLVAGAAALFVILGEASLAYFVQRFSADYVRADPIRILEAIVAGFTVLGAGTILRHRPEDSIEGLTTAASMIFTTGLGIAVALDQVYLGFGATLLAFITLRVIGLIENKLADREI